LKQVTAGATFAARTGGAFGVAALVRGIGVTALRDFGIMTRLQAAMQNDKSAHARQGALLTYERLFKELKAPLFEPYVPVVLPDILACFGDTSIDVRIATQTLVVQLLFGGVIVFVTLVYILFFLAA
jgi:hypothetical protein